LSLVVCSLDLGLLRRAQIFCKGTWADRSRTPLPGAAPEPDILLAHAHPRITIASLHEWVCSFLHCGLCRLREFSWRIPTISRPGDAKVADTRCHFRTRRNGMAPGKWASA